MMMSKLDLLRWRPKTSLGIIFVVAVLLRLTFIFLFTGFHVGQLDLSTMPGGDEKGYVMLAKNIAEGKQYGEDAGVWGRMWRAPIYPGFIATLFLLFGYSLALVQFCQGLLGGLVCILIYLIGQKVFDSTIGLLSAIYFALYPPHIYISGQILSENLSVLLVLVIVFLFLKVATGLNVWQATFCGAVLGIATLTKPESGGIAIGVIGLTAAIVCAQATRKAYVIAAVIFSMALVLSPWLIRNYRISGRLVLSTVGGEAFWGGNNEYTLNDPKWRGHWKLVNEMPEFKSVLAEKTEIERDRRRWNLGIEFLKNHKADIPRLAYYKLKRFYTVILEDRVESLIMILSFGVLAPFIAVGFIVSLISFLKQRHPGLILHVTVLYYNFIAVVFWGSNRFRLSIDPFLIMLGIYAFVLSITYLRSIASDGSYAYPPESR